MIHWSEVQGAEAQALASSEEALEKEVDLYQGGGAPPTPEGGESGRGSAQEGARASSGVAGAGGAPRVFRKRYGKLVFDETPASDAWAMHNGWVSVTLLSLQQDIVGACRDAYRACAGAVEGCGQGVLPDESAPHAEDVVLSPHRARSSLPFDFMGDAERIVAARFGDSRLAALGAVTQVRGSGGRCGSARAVVQSSLGAGRRAVPAACRPRALPWARRSGCGRPFATERSRCRPCGGRRGGETTGGRAGRAKF